MPNFTTAACLPLLVLAGCGHRGTSVSHDAGGGETVTIANPQGGNVTAVIGDTARVPTDMPAWAPAYPGSKVLVAQAQNGSGPPVKTVTLSTPDPLAKVSAFYARKIAEAGVKPMQTTTTGDVSMTIIQTRAGISAVNVTRNEEDGGSMISITYGMQR